MERNFMGLAVKQEAPDEVIDAAPLRSSTMQWSFSNKGPGIPQLLSFQAQEEKPKTGFESLVSTGLVTITTSTTSDHSEHKPFSGVMQKNIASESQSVRYTMTTYPAKQIDTHPIYHHQSFIPVSPQPLSMAIPSPVVGTTNLRNTPSQLTIFYNGSVCVYDNISQEKAQAIMLLAGNAPPVQAPPIKNASVLGSSNKVEPLKVVVSSNFIPSGTVPQFRRKSLARFLEKRKERVINTSPYASKGSPECSPPVPAAN